MIPSNFRIIDFNEPGLIRNINPDETFDSVMLVVHDRDTKDNFLIRADKLQILPEQYDLGYFDGHDAHVIFASTEEGYALDGRFRFDGALMTDRGSKWYEAYTKDKNYMIEEEGIYTLIDCYRFITYSTGDNYLPFIQRAIINFVPIEPHIPYFPSEKTRESFLSRYTVPAFSFTSDSWEKYGISRDEQNLLHYLLYEKQYREGRRIVQVPVPMALKYLGNLNGYSTGSKLENFIEGPNQFEVESILSELEFQNFDETNNYIGELDKFSWRDENGNIMLDQTFKEWIDLFIQKILYYEGNNLKILYAKSLLSNIDTNLIHASDRFTNNELLAVSTAMDLLFLLIGHSTIRYMFKGMFRARFSGNNVKIDILSKRSLDIIDDLREQIGFQSIESQRGDPTGRLRANEYKDYNIFGMSYLEARLALERTSGGFEYYKFPIGPLPSIEGIVASDDYKDFIRKIGHNFEDQYRDAHLDNIKNILREFSKSQTKIFELIRQRIFTKITLENPFGDKAKNKMFEDKLTDKAWRDLFYTRIARVGFDTIRKKLEDFSRSTLGEYTRIYFDGLTDPSTGNNFFITISKQELIDLGFIEWGYIDIGHELPLDTQYDLKVDYNSKYQENLVEIMEDIINKWCAVEGEELGIARIFPLEYIDDYLGYQFIIPRISSSGTVYAHALKHLKYIPKSPPYFEINLNTPEGRLELARITAILISTDFAFVVKDSAGEWDDGRMICAFNFNGFLDKDEIYSVSGVNDFFIANKLENYQMVIDEVPQDFFISEYSMRWISYFYKISPFFQQDFNKFVRENYP
jgi:hypothetical protein